LKKIDRNNLKEGGAEFICFFSIIQLKLGVYSLIKQYDIIGLFAVGELKAG